MASLLSAVVGLSPNFVKGKYGMVFAQWALRMPVVSPKKNAHDGGELTESDVERFNTMVLRHKQDLIAILIPSFPRLSFGGFSSKIMSDAIHLTCNKSWEDMSLCRAALPILVNLACHEQANMLVRTMITCCPCDDTLNSIASILAQSSVILVGSRWGRIVLKTAFSHLEEDFAQEVFQTIAQHRQSHLRGNETGRVSNTLLLSCLIEEESAETLKFCTKNIRRLLPLEREKFCRDILFPGALSCIFSYSHSHGKIHKFWIHLTQNPELLPVFLDTLEKEAGNLLPQILSDEVSEQKDFIPKAMVCFIRGIHKTGAIEPQWYLATLLADENVFAFFIDIMGNASISHDVKESVTCLIIKHMDILLQNSQAEEVDSCWRVHRLLGCFREAVCIGMGNVTVGENKNTGVKTWVKTTVSTMRLQSMVLTQVSDHIKKLQQSRYLAFLSNRRMAQKQQDQGISHSPSLCYLNTLLIWERIFSGNFDVLPDNKSVGDTVVGRYRLY